MSPAPIAPVNSHDRPKRETTSRSFLIATGFVMIGAAFSATNTDLMGTAMHALGFSRAATAGVVDQQSQAAAIAKLENGLGFVLRQIDGLKSRDGRPSTDPSVEDRLAQLDSELGQLKTQSDTLRAAQSDTSEELGHIRAQIANADIGLGQLRSSIDDRDATQRKAIADVNGRVDRLTHVAAAGDVTGSIPAAPARRRAYRSMSSWSVQDAWDDGAVISGTNGSLRVTVGTAVPGLGHITSVRQRGDRWVVTTDHGVIVQR